MAVGFQRRNIGRLAELTNAGDGTSAYVDYGAAPIADATAAPDTPAEPAPAPAQGEVLPADPAADGMARAEQAAQMLIKAAEAQRKGAGNPLNRVLSAVGGVVGAPFAFLDAALGGGDMQQVTAPFRPQQAANQRYAMTMLNIQDNLAKIRENYAQMGSANSTALKTALASRREAQDAAFTDFGRWAAGLLYVDPAQREQVAREGLPMLIQRHPEMKPYLKTFTNLSDASLIRLATSTKDETARALLTDYLGNKTVATGEGTALIMSNRPGVAPQFIDRSSPDPRFRTPEASPYVSSAPVPFTMTPGPNDVLAAVKQSGQITPEQMTIIKEGLNLGANGQAQMDAWLKDNNITVVQPQGGAAAPEVPPLPPGFVLEN